MAAKKAKAEAAKAVAATLDLAPGALDVPTEPGEEAAPTVGPEELDGAAEAEGEESAGAPWVNWLTGERRHDPPRIATSAEAALWLLRGEAVQAPPALVAAEKARAEYEARQVAAAKAEAAAKADELTKSEARRVEELRQKRDRYIARLKTRAGV